MTKHVVSDGQPHIDVINTPVAASVDTLLKTIAPEAKVSLPIDVERVAELLGLQVQKLCLEPNVDGLLVKDKAGEPFKAVVDAFAHEHRQRFTIAHEIGHYIHKYQDVPVDEVMGRVERRDDTSSKGVEPEEIWANRFAAALLMPASIVRRYWGKGLSSEELADKFNVSVRSMDVRLSTLGLK